MSHRRHLILGVTLVAQLALILIFRSPFGAASVRQEARPLLPALETAKPTKLEIDGAGAQKITLEKSGDAWGVDELGGFPVDGKKVDDLLSSLKGLRVRRPIVESSRYHEQFKVSDKTHEGRVKLWAEGQADPAVDLLLGSSPDYRTLNVRVAGADPVYEVRGLASYDVRADAGAWIKKEVLEGVQESDITELQVQNAKGAFGVRKQSGAWVVTSPEKMKGRTLNADKAAALVRAVAGLRLSDGAGKVDDTGQGFAPAAATVWVKWESKPPEGAPEAPSSMPPGERTIRIGAKAQGKETERYVSWSGFGYTGTVWDSSVTSLVEDGLDKLLVS
jgi:hypothetical protein